MVSYSLILKVSNSLVLLGLTGLKYVKKVSLSISQSLILCLGAGFFGKYEQAPMDPNGPPAGTGQRLCVDQ